MGIEKRKEETFFFFKVEGEEKEKEGICRKK